MARSKQYLQSGCSSSWCFLILAQRAVEYHLSHFVGWPRTPIVLSPSNASLGVHQSLASLSAGIRAAIARRQALLAHSASGEDAQSHEESSTETDRAIYSKQLCVGALPLALDIASGQKDPTLTTEQPEQDSDPVTPCHAGVDREVIAERTA
jgi:hypothetical protein